MTKRPPSVIDDRENTPRHGQSRKHTRISLAGPGSPVEAKHNPKALPATPSVDESTSRWASFGSTIEPNLPAMSLVEREGLRDRLQNLLKMVGDTLPPEITAQRNDDMPVKRAGGLMKVCAAAGVSYNIAQQQYWLGPLSKEEEGEPEKRGTNWLDATLPDLRHDPNGIAREDIPYINDLIIFDRKRIVEQEKLHRGVLRLEPDMLAEYVGPTLNLSNIVVPGGALTTRSLTFNSSIYGYGDFAKDHITNLDGFLVSVQCAQYEGFEHAIERCFMYMKNIQGAFDMHTHRKDPAAVLYYGMAGDGYRFKFLRLVHLVPAPGKPDFKLLASNSYTCAVYTDMIYGFVDAIFAGKRLRSQAAVVAA